MDARASAIAMSEPPLLAVFSVLSGLEQSLRAERRFTKKNQHGSHQCARSDAGGDILSMPPR
jgi:hypothetical protein